MLGATSMITSVLGAAPEATAPTATLKSFARACCQAGLWVLLIEPYGKKPVDMRTAVQKRKEDTAAQQVARSEGRPDWDKVKSKGGVYLSTNDETVIGRYIERYRNTYESDYDEDCPINFGIDVGRSNLLVVDCDTSSQVQAFLTDFGAPPDLAPTVRTPGQVDEAGNWSHSNGGHFYFTLDHPLPEYSGSLTAPGGYVLLWSGRYVLIPPSVRAEGKYRLSGQDFPETFAPKLRNMVTSAVNTRTARRLDALADTDLTDAVNAWSADVTWDELLSPAGWSMTARQDNCGCDIWTAPGDHGSPKSATAHDVECSLGRYNAGEAVLHIWTDNPGPQFEEWMAAHGGKTMSRLQVAAVLEYGGNVGAAMRELGVMPDQSEALGFGKDLAHELGTSMANLDEPLESSSFGFTPPEVAPNPFVDAGSVASEEDTDEPERVNGAPHIQPFDYWRDYPAPEFAIEGILEHRSFAALIGPPGVGKTGVALDMAGALCTGTRWMGRKTMRQRVLYLPGEGMAGAVQRVKAWEQAHELDLGTDFFIGDSIIQVAASSEAWSAVIQRMLEFEIGQLIIDTFARAAVGLEENSAKDVGKAIGRFDQVRKTTGAGLLVVHHTTKAGNSGRGSSALHGSLDTELLVNQHEWWPDADQPCPGRQLTMFVSKQKNAAQPEHGIDMLAVPYGDSFVMTGPSGIIGDPLDDVVSPRAIVPETIVSVALRLQEFAQRFTTQGLTRTEFAYGVHLDAYTANRKDAKTAWRMTVNEAIDLGLRYGLLQTLTGTATGARYIPDVTTKGRAMELWSQEGTAELQPE